MCNITKGKGASIKMKVGACLEGKGACVKEKEAFIRGRPKKGALVRRAKRHLLQRKSGACQSNRGHFRSE